MAFDFDKLITRRGTNSYKWDSYEDDEVLPMWVADMDFQTAPCIIEALKQRVNHGIFGYTQVPESYYEAIISWMKNRHQWDVKREWIQYTTGVVPAISCVLKALTMPGEKVLVLTPVYNCFFSSIRNTGCEVLESPLVREEDSYRIDFEDVERKCEDDKTTVLLLCNPHNPVGRVWSKDELGRLNDICLRHHVRVVSDEIHCELVMPGYHFVPFAAVSDDCLANSITLTSPSKAFNTAGLQIANIICSDAETRRRIDRAININEVCDVNSFGPIALEAAYRKGAEWLDALNEYIYGNYLALKEFCSEYLPQVEIIRMEATYLVWMDISALELTSDEAAEKLLHEGKVMVSSGTMYGKQAGQGYLRINIACPRSRMMEGLKRIAKVLSAYQTDMEEIGCPI